MHHWDHHRCQPRHLDWVALMMGDDAPESPILGTQLGPERPEREREREAAPARPILPPGSSRDGGGQKLGGNACNFFLTFRYSHNKLYQ